MSIRDRDFGDYWAKRKRQIAATKSKGQCLVDFSKRGRRFQVTAADTNNFYHKAYLAGGKYRKRTGLWVFAGKDSKEVLALCRQCFGRENVVILGYYQEQEEKPAEAANE